LKIILLELSNQKVTGSKFILTRRLINKENGCEVTHCGYFEGFFGSIIGIFLKAKYTPLLEKSVFKLKELCENKI
jgi:hypothetical protein